MNYAETLEYLYSQLPMFSRIGSAAYKEDLHNTIALCNHIGNPHERYKKIHIAGTNGKGSTSHMLASILQEAGYKTGLYTSPHIKDFRERIRINGEMISENFVVEFTERTKQITADIQPSFFELTVAMAFEYFAENEVDVAVIETGLGGLLDSTNIITPILSVITNIGLDHQNILGNSIEKIALQKAGIIKPNIPVVIGETIKETKEIFKRTAIEKGSPIHFAEYAYKCLSSSYTNNQLALRILNKSSNNVLEYRLDLLGAYQTKNICTVLTAIEKLNEVGITIPNTALLAGLSHTKQNTGLRGRWDILKTNPTIIADVAHNRDGIVQIIQQLEADYPAAKKHFVLGFVKDKDVETILALFPKNGMYYFTQAHISRALPTNELMLKGENASLVGAVYEDVNLAVDGAIRGANTNDVIIICGSFFIVAESNLI